MASSCKRDNGMFMFKANRTDFFKIILQESITDGKLRIPKKFVRMYGNGLSNKVRLKIPTGAGWEVELLRHNGEIWLQNGWKEFVEYFSLAHGSFLVFEYEGNSVFHVLIFDMSALEIDYPFSMTHENHDLGAEFDQEPSSGDDVSVEIIDHHSFSPCRKTKKKSPLPCPLARKKTRSNLKVIRRTQPLTSEEKANAIDRAAAAFNSENPFFMRAMQPSYLDISLGIPYSFAKKYFKEKNGYAILRISDGRTWTVKYSFTISKAKGNARFYGSWKGFASDNNLEIGDVCVFELIKGSEILLEVTIFRANANSQS